MLDLAVIMPVFNEEECIVSVVRDWIQVLNGLGIEYRLLVIDDGSIDGTANSLKAFANNSRVEIISRDNRGHGPTVLQGYKACATRAKWIFQCDSDDEISASEFPRLWDMRCGYDALLGVRMYRTQDNIRRLMSSVARIAVRLLSGPGIMDINIPFRLIKGGIIGRLMRWIPANAFAPNVMLSSALVGSGARIANVGVEYTYRRTGVVSIKRLKALMVAVRSFVQLLTFWLALPPTCRQRITARGVNCDG